MLYGSRVNRQRIVYQSRCIGLCIVPLGLSVVRLHTPSNKALPKLHRTNWAEADSAICFRRVRFIGPEQVRRNWKTLRPDTPEGAGMVVAPWNLGLRV